MTANDIKVGQVWVWVESEDEFTIVSIVDGNITWDYRGNTFTNYSVDQLLRTHDAGYAKLKTYKLQYKMDTFKFI
jgi:hypothetical protein